MTYYHELARALRTRRLPEDEVLRILRETRATELTLDVPLRQELGEPAQHAADFPTGRTRSLGSWIAISGAVVVLGYLAVAFFVEPLPRPPLVSLLVVVAGSVIGFFVDKRLPAGFDEADTVPVVDPEGPAPAGGPDADR